MNKEGKKVDAFSYQYVKREILQRLGIQGGPRVRCGRDLNGSEVLLANHLEAVSAVAAKHPEVRRKLARLTDDQLINFLEGRPVDYLGRSGRAVRPARIRHLRNREIVIEPARMEDAETAAARNRRTKIIAWRECLRSAKTVREDQFHAALLRAQDRRTFYMNIAQDRRRVNIQMHRFQREPRIFDLLRARSRQLFDLEEREPQRVIPGVPDAGLYQRPHDRPTVEFLRNFVVQQALPGNRELPRDPNNPENLDIPRARDMLMAAAVDHQNERIPIRIGQIPPRRPGNNLNNILWFRARAPRNRREQAEAQRLRQQHEVAGETTLECGMCGRKRKLAEFYRHYMHCQKSTTASKMTQKRALFEYFQTEYVSHKMFQELSDELEMEFYVAKINNEDQSNEAACALCETFEEHQEGKCFQDGLIQSFKQRAKLIINELMAQFTQHRHMEKEFGMMEIENKHNEHFATLEEMFNSDPCDDELEAQRERDWYEFRKTTIDAQTLEKHQYLVDTAESDTKAISDRQISLESDLLKYSQLLSTTVQTNTETRNLHVARALVRQYHRDCGLEVPEGFRIKDEQTGEPVVDIDLNSYLRDITEEHEEIPGPLRLQAQPASMSLRRRWGFLNRRGNRAGQAVPNPRRREREAENNVEHRLDLLDMHPRVN